MGELSSVDGEATPYHLPWGGAQKLRVLMGWGSQVQVWGLPTYCAASRASMVVQGRLGWLWPLLLYILWPSPPPQGRATGALLKNPLGEGSGLHNPLVTWQGGWA